MELTLEWFRNPWSYSELKCLDLYWVSILLRSQSMSLEVKNLSGALSWFCRFPNRGSLLCLASGSCSKQIFFFSDIRVKWKPHTINHPIEIAFFYGFSTYTLDLFASIFPTWIACEKKNFILLSSRPHTFCPRLSISYFQCFSTWRWNLFAFLIAGKFI